MKCESTAEIDIKARYTIGFVEGLVTAKEIIADELKDAIQNGTIIITKGSERIFEIIDSVGKLSPEEDMER